MQAIDRIHSIGQTRDVTVIRLFVRNSVEERILLLQQRKQQMINDALGMTMTNDEKRESRLNDFLY